MADYPYNFAGILEAIAGGINSFVKTRSDMAVFQQERARQEARDAAEREFQQAQLALEGRRTAADELRAKTDAETAEFTRGEYVQELKDKLTEAGFNEREQRAIMAEMDARSQQALARGEQEQLRLLQRITELSQSQGVDAEGNPVADIPPQVRDNLLTTMMDQLDVLDASTDDPALKQQLLRLKFTLPSRIASGKFTEADAATLLDLLYPQAPAAAGAESGEAQPSKSSSFGRSRAARFGGAVGRGVGTAVREAGELIPAPFGGAIPAAKWLFAPMPEEAVSGAASEVRALAQPDTLGTRVEERRKRDRQNLYRGSQYRR